MQLSLEVQEPDAFAQTVAFLRSFPLCEGDYIVTEHSITAAVSVRGIARELTVHAGRPLTVDVPRHSDLATQHALLARAADLVGAHGDALRELRFLTAEELAVYGVLMQGATLAQASAYKRRFLDAFGIPVSVRVELGARTLRAMPEIDQLVELDAHEIARAIGHPRNAARIADVVRDIAARGAHAAPYAIARDVLLALPCREARQLWFA